MGRFLNNEVSSQLREIFNQMTKATKIVLFIDGSCDTCLETKQLLEETVELTDKLSLDVFEIKEQTEEAKKYDVTLAPSFVFLDDKGVYQGVKFNGIPGNHEFITFITAIMEMGGAPIPYPESIVERIKKIDKPVNIKVFVTLSCPHCPEAVTNAHRIAMLNKNVSGEMIEAQTFYELSQQYNVSGVPKIVINDKYELVGNQPVEQFLKVIESL